MEILVPGVVVSLLVSMKPVVGTVEYGEETVVLVELALVDKATET